MKPSTMRNAERWLHIGVGSIIAVYIYSPWGEDPTFQFLTKVVVIPITVISGMWLWKGHLVRRKFNFLPKAVATVLFLISFSAAIHAQSLPEEEKQMRWGVEMSPVGAGVFRLFQAKATYLINPERKFHGEIGFGLLIQPESDAKASESFNSDGTYSAYMGSVAFRQYLWKGLHMESVVNLGNANNRQNKIDGRDYNAFVIFTQNFLGYKLSVIKRENFNLYVIGQGGFGYVPINTNQWPRISDSSIYGLGDLKIGFNF